MCKIYLVSYSIISNNKKIKKFRLQTLLEGHVRIVWEIHIALDVRFLKRRINLHLKNIFKGWSRSNFDYGLSRKDVRRGLMKTKHKRGTGLTQIRARPRNQPNYFHQPNQQILRKFGFFLEIDLKVWAHTNFSLA